MNACSFPNALSTCDASYSHSRICPCISTATQPGNSGIVYFHMNVIFGGINQIPFYIVFNFFSCDINYVGLIKGPQGNCPAGTWTVAAKGRENTIWACCVDCPGGTSFCYDDCTW